MKTQATDAAVNRRFRANLLTSILCTCLRQSARMRGFAHSLDLTENYREISSSSLKESIANDENTVIRLESGIEGTVVILDEIEMTWNF